METEIELKKLGINHQNHNKKNFLMLKDRQGKLKTAAETAADIHTSQYD